MNQIKIRRGISPLPWIGGKSLQWKIIKSYLPRNIDIFVEPFVGGGSVMLNVINEYHPRIILINDINKDVFSFWQAVREEDNNIEDLCWKFSSSKVSFESAKENFKNYNGNFSFWLETNLKFNGHFQGSWSETRFAQNLNDAKFEKLKNASKILKNSQVNILNENYDSIPCIKNAVYYIDPPYFSNKGKPYKFGLMDWEKFKSWIYFLNFINAKIIISLDDCKETRSMFPEFNIYSESWHYSSTTSNKKQTIGKELIITNFK